jgi:hypothetical protein
MVVTGPRLRSWPSRHVLVVITSSFRTWLSIPLAGCLQAGCVAG